MDYQKFIDCLPDLYENWNQESVHPKSGRFQPVLEQVNSLTTPNVMQLLNFAVECMEPGEVYCEVGCFQGSTLIGALLDHPDKMAYAVDNFSQFDFQGKNLDQLTENINKFQLKEQVLFCDQDFEDFFIELREVNNNDKIGVYFYDGAHDYRSQLVGLLLVKYFLADKALIIVDDSNYNAVQQANWDFIATHCHCQLLVDLPTPHDRHNTFWNGIQVLSWDRDRDHKYESSILQKVRNPLIISAIYNLQWLNHFKVSG